MPSSWAVVAAWRILNHLDVEDLPFPLATIIDQCHAQHHASGRHYHVASHDGTDACAQCGLDLRNEVHLRVGELDKLLREAATNVVTEAEIDRAIALASDVERMDWLETQLCWIGMQGNLEVNPKYAAGGPCRRTVREACDAGILADRSTESA